MTTGSFIAGLLGASLYMLWLIYGQLVLIVKIMDRETGWGDH